MNKDELRREAEAHSEELMVEEPEVNVEENVDTEDYTESSENTEDDDVDTEEMEETEEKKRFSKKASKKKEDKAKEKIEELEGRYMRQLAEFENFRKRTEIEKSRMFDMGAKSVLEKVLPVVDNFERGLKSLPEDKAEDPFVDGMNKVYKQLLSELEGIGVVPIPAVGEAFDPEVHNAVMQVSSEEYEEGIVAQELLKGYKYKNTVVRHSMVAVVNE